MARTQRLLPKPSNRRRSPPVQAVIDQLDSVVQGDASRLRDSYSTHKQQRVTSKHSWDEALNLYRAMMAKEFGGSPLADFSYAYPEKDQTNGVVTILIKGKKVEGREYRVVLESGVWKVN